MRACNMTQKGSLSTADIEYALMPGKVVGLQNLFSNQRLRR